MVTSPHPVFYGLDWFEESPLTPYLWYLDPENNSWREGMEADFALTFSVQSSDNGRLLTVRIEGKGPGLDPSGHTKKILTFRVDGSAPVLESSTFFDYRPSVDACAFQLRASDFWSTPSGHLLPKRIIHVSRSTEGVMVRFSVVGKTWTPPWPTELTRLTIPRETKVRGVKPDAPGVTVTSQSTTLDVMKIPANAHESVDVSRSDTVNGVPAQSGILPWVAIASVGAMVLVCLLMVRRWRLNRRTCASEPDDK